MSFTRRTSGANDVRRCEHRHEERTANVRVHDRVEVFERRVLNVIRHTHPGIVQLQQHKQQYHLSATTTQPHHTHPALFNYSNTCNGITFSNNQAATCVCHMRTSIVQLQHLLHLNRMLSDCTVLIIQ